MSLTRDQTQKLDSLLIQYTRHNSNEDNDIRDRNTSISAISSVVKRSVNKSQIHLDQYDIRRNKPYKDFFTSIIRICFPGQQFTLQTHESGTRDIKRSTDTKDYSGAVAYVFTLPNRTVRFYTRLWRRHPDFLCLHQVWMANDVEVDSDADTDTELTGHFIDIMSALNARISVLEEHVTKGH